MSELSYKQETDLLEGILEGLQHGQDDYEQAVAESIDSALPIYYTDLVTEWVEAGMPQPDDNNSTDILVLMASGLYETYSWFAWDVISEATNASEALEIVQVALGVRKGYTQLAQAIIA